MTPKEILVYVFILLMLIMRCFCKFSGYLTYLVNTPGSLYASDTFPGYVPPTPLRTNHHTIPADYHNVFLFAGVFLLLCVVFAAAGPFCCSAVVPTIRCATSAVRLAKDRVKEGLVCLFRVVKRGKLAEVANQGMVNATVGTLEVVAGISGALIVALVEAAMLQPEVPVAQESLMERMHREWKEEDRQHELAKQANPYYWQTKTPQRAPRRGRWPKGGPQTSVPESTRISHPIPTPLLSSELTDRGRWSKDGPLQSTAHSSSLLSSPPLFPPSIFAKRCGSLQK